MRIVKWDKKPISKSGVFSQIPLEIYHSSGIVSDGEYSVSSSGLRTFWSRSAAHFFDGWPYNPKSEPMKPTRPMILGSGAHHLLLGEALFATQYIGQPLEYPDKKTGELKPWHNASNFCRDWQDKQVKAGRTVLTQVELQHILGMARSLALEPLVVAGALQGAVECSMIVKDKETGLWLRGRPDVIPTGGGDYVDLKTAREVTNVGIFTALRSSGYHMQGALLWEIASQLGLPFESFTLIFVESDRPYCVRAVPVHDDDLSRGRLQCRAMLRKIADCIDKGHWPGPGEGSLQPMPLPTTEREAIDARLKYEGVV